MPYKIGEQICVGDLVRVDKDPKQRFSLYLVVDIPDIYQNRVIRAVDERMIVRSYARNLFRDQMTPIK